MKDDRNTKEEIQVGKGVGFQRIKRVTGYLTSDTKFMNNAKLIEVSERVKHASVKD